MKKNPEITTLYPPHVTPPSRFKRLLLWFRGVYQFLTGYYVICKNHTDAAGNRQTRHVRPTYYLVCYPTIDWTTDYKKAAIIGLLRGWLIVKLLERHARKHRESGFEYFMVSLNDILFIESIINPSITKDDFR